MGGKVCCSRLVSCSKVVREGFDAAKKKPYRRSCLVYKAGREIGLKR